MICIDNSLILHIYVIIRKYYHIYVEKIHVFYIWVWNNAEKSILCLIEFYCVNLSFVGE